MSKNKKENIVVSFNSPNSEHVTGSCIHIKMYNKEILLECGMYQSCGSILSNYRINNRKLDFKPKNIDYIFVGHIHGDHILEIPRLYKMGCEATIIMPENSVELAKILMEDCVYIIQKDCEALERKGVCVEPIYDIEDVENCLSHVVEYKIGEKVVLDDDITFQYVPSGHLPNAAQIKLWLKKINNQVKTIAYTSDLGNTTTHSLYSNKFKPIDKANLFIGEATYCLPERQIKVKDRDKDIEKLESIIRQTCIEDKGKVLIPCFANARTQEILSRLYEIFGINSDFTIPVIIDSPMAVKISKLYEKIISNDKIEFYKKALNWKNLRFVSEYEDSKILQQSNEPMIILSSSGMLTAGRSVAWCQRLLPNAKNHIIIVGFASEHSIAGKIKAGKQKTITIEGKSIPNKCCVTCLKSFSSHMQRDKLLEYYSNVNADKIAIVHAKFEDKVEFCKDLQTEITKKYKTSKVLCVNHSTTIKL